MAHSIQPIIVTSDLDRALRFYRELLGAKEHTRVPEEGTPFFAGLRVGGSGLGLVADAEAAPTLNLTQEL